MKKLNIAIGVLLLSACFNENNQSTCTAPSYNSDGSFTQEEQIRCYTPLDMQGAYGLNVLYDMGLTGLGQTIVLIDSYGSLTAEEDLTVFHENFFPNKDMPEFQQIILGTPDYYEDWGGEIALDVQWAHAIAPDAAIHLIMAELGDGESDTIIAGAIEAITYVANNYPAGTVVSMSFGDPESAYTEGYYTDTELLEMEAALQLGIENGITFFASAGDYGSSSGEDEPSILYPASSAYVTAVGGTLLQYGWSWYPNSDSYTIDYVSYNPDYFNTNNNPMQRLETVWNEAWLGLATGGGISTLFDIPDWQAPVADKIYANSGSGRGIPDLAWSASVNGGVLIYDDGTWEVVGGTSSSSPQTAAFFSLMNQHLASEGMDYIGHLNPWLYQLNDGNAFNDILPVSQGTVLAGEQVSNQLFEYLDDGSLTYSDVAGYSTTQGWDLTTGFGSPRGKAFLDALVAVMSENDD